MVRLVIEKMAGRDHRLLNVIQPPIIPVGERSGKEIFAQIPEKLFDPRIQRQPFAPQLGKTVRQNRIKRRRLLPASLEPRHPYPIGQQEVVQKAVDTAE